MTKMIISASALAIVAGAASADRVGSLSVDALSATPISFQAPRGMYSENFEGFALGSGIQNGWNSAFAPNFTIVDTGIAGFGQRTAQHMSDESGFSGIEVRSPIFGPQSSIAADIRINDMGPVGTSLYQLVTIGSGSTTFNTRLNFNSDGTIEALQAVGGVGVFAMTTGSWSAGQVTRIGIEALGNGALNIYQDNSLIFSGLDINFVINGSASGIGELGIWALNDAATGADTMYLDNLAAIPAPGAAAVLGLAGLAGFRRRR